ncbi:uncharacterized protein LOC124814524 [Hydra vulgaris]|uniref:uncharacterized protein LOC124814524 n=1 Tax=Hydra vulgaris TaxID=6087 RepID=UPI001F5EC7C6|nr:uncharacterized protein LOC124814523 [Hydra vulgaris]
MEHDWVGPAIITDFKPTGAVVSLNSKVWKSAVAMPNIKPYLEKNLNFISSNILKEHNYCLQITDKIHLNEESCECASSSFMALNIASTLMYDLERKKMKDSQVRDFPTSPSDFYNCSNSNYDYSNKILAVEEVKPVDSVVKKVKFNSICRSLNLSKVSCAIPDASNFYSELSTQCKNKALDILKNPSGWLDDTLIDIAQSLLSYQFPKISGFQSSCILSCFNSGGYSESCSFIQIINIRNSHWVLLSNVSSDDLSDSKCVQFYDSLFNSSNECDVPLLVHTVARSSLNCHTSSSLIVEVMDCQMQQNGNDCGLFAIANAAASTQV